MSFQKYLQDVFKIVGMPVRSAAAGLSFPFWGKTDLSSKGKKQQQQRSPAAWLEVVFISRRAGSFVGMNI